MKDVMERTMSIVLTVCAVIFAGIMIRREFFPTRSERGVSGVPQYTEGWRQALATGQLSGDATAPVTILEFGDLECPYCRTFNQALNHTIRSYPKQVAFVFVHFPLSGHRFARPAARVVECAKTFGKFFEGVDMVYNKQDSLGLKSWSSYANGLGISDTGRFNRCIADTTKMPAVEAGVALAHKMDITGTPTVFVNGWRFAGPPSDSVLAKVVGDILAGRKPFDGYKVAQRN
jgi:protein-disulfide isomerase